MRQGCLITIMLSPLSEHFRTKKLNCQLHIAFTCGISQYFPSLFSNLLKRQKSVSHYSVTSFDESQTIAATKNVNLSKLNMHVLFFSLHWD